MGLKIKVRNEIRTNRVVTGYMLTPETLVEVVLEIQGDIKQPSGIIVNMLDVQRLFTRLIGGCWNNATIAQRGNKVDVNFGRVEYVEFSPSLENIAKYVYDKMMPIILRKYKVILTQVTTKSDMGNATYKDES